LIGVLDIEQSIRSIHIDQIQNEEVDLDDIMGDFRGTYTAILSVIQDQDAKHRAKKERTVKAANQAVKVKTTTDMPTVEPTLGIKRRAKENNPSIPSKKPKNAIPPSRTKTPPNQLSTPVDPNFSGCSTESKDEENTKHLIGKFVEDTLSVVRKDVRRLSWVNSECTVELVKMFLLLSFTDV
jgi:hypothetical protein